MNQLPVSRVVNVGVNLAPLAAQSQSLSNLLLLGTSNVIDTVERFREYGTLEAVALDFGGTAPEYLAAQAWFAQRPQPKNLIVGRWYQAAVAGGLRCGPLTAAQQALANFTVVGANGTLAIAKDGGAPTNVTAINLAAVTSMDAVAAAISAGTGFPAGVTCVWNQVYQRFEFKSTTPGAASAVAFLTAAGTGTDISSLIRGKAADGGYVFLGSIAETAAAAFSALENMIGQRFYGLVVLGLVPGAGGTADNDALLAVSAAVEASGTKHLFGITTQEAGAISAVSTTDVAYRAKAAKYLRTVVQYSSTSPYAVMSLLGRILTVDYEGDSTAITLKFKQQPGVVAEQLTQTQANALGAKNCNVFVGYNNDTAIVEEGKVASGEFVDTVTGTDWLATTVQREVYNALYTSTGKIPQTDEGMGILKAVVERRCAQAVDNGLCAPGVWTGDGFGKLKTNDYLAKGYYVYSAPVSTQSAANRAARMAMPIQVAVKLAGAIHSADVTINVNN